MGGRNQAAMGAMAGLVLSVLVTASALAQEEDKAKPFVYGIYYECDVAKQELADEIVDLVYAPAFDAAVEEGSIQSWGWLSHHTGSTWRRLLYHTAPDMTQLLASLESILEQVNEKQPEMGRAFGEICGRHDDYIWRGVGGSGSGGIAVDRGKAAFSVYFKCDMSKEDRADELVSQVFAPIYNSYVESGSITSWSWLTHVVGGKYRRLLAMTGADHAALIKARGQIITEMVENHEEAGKEFNQICGSHSDYMWDIVQEKP